MPIKRLTVYSVLASTLIASGSLLAAPSVTDTLSINAAPQLMNQLPVFNPAPMLAQASVAADLVPAASLSKASSALPTAKLASRAASQLAVSEDDEAQLGNDVSDLRRTLINLAMNLRDIRYVRGGHDPSTGFDCSGFVRYVFAHAIGLNLPTNSAAQFLSGLKVDRSHMQPGDLVFFRTAGRHGRGRISHVGIYVADGRFIHSPSHGKTVRVDSLDEAYWAERFAGAKRPEAIARNG